MEQEDSFVESVESLIETIKRLIVKPVKRITGFASVGFLLVVLLILALIFLFIGIIKIMQGIGLLLGINPTGFAFASIGLLFLIMALRNYWRRSNDDVAIIGSGPAGYTAGIYAGRANLQPILFEGLESGGQLMLTTDVENYPGFVDGIMGPELMQVFKGQAERFGTTIKTEIVDSIENIDGGFKLKSSKGEYEFKTVIIASGASARWLGVDGEKELQGYGVSACATCDGFFFKEKEVAVVGGGDSAMEEALFLTKFAKKVYVIHRRNQFRASQIMQDRVLNHEKIEVVWNSTVEKINGEGAVSSILIKDTIDSSEKELNLDGVFVAIGHDPNVGFLDGFIELDNNGYIKTGFTTETSTSVPGVFAAGDVADSIYRQAITAAGTGCQAAIDAERWLEH